MDSLRRGRRVVFQNHVACLIQNAVVAGPVSQVQTDGQLGSFENLVPVFRHSAILFHKPVSFPLRLERVDPWERIASGRRPAFSSHLINEILLIRLAPLSTTACRSRAAAGYPVREVS